MISGIQDIIFNGHSLTEYGCVITEPPNRPFPVRDYEKLSVYGRSGELVIDSGSYKNFPLTYKVVTIPSLYNNRFIDEVLTELKEWLCSSISYQKLYDTELPNGFYYAFCSGISDAVCAFDYMYEFEITFDCKPFFYFDSGQETIQTSEKNITLYNIGNRTAIPSIEIYGSGTISCYIRDKSFTIKNINSNVIVDSETKLVYSGGENKSEDFDGIYPTLDVGSNVISFTGDSFKSAKITPRWCRL